VTEWGTMRVEDRGSEDGEETSGRAGVGAAAAATGRDGLADEQGVGGDGKTA
jgi:hypothetical protein